MHFKICRLTVGSFGVNWREALALRYDLRKKYLVQKLTLEKASHIQTISTISVVRDVSCFGKTNSVQELLGNRARFIEMIIAKKLHVNNRKKAGQRT